MVPWGCLWFVIVVFPDHTHLLFLVLDLGHYLINFLCGTDRHQILPVKLLEQG